VRIFEYNFDEVKKKIRRVRVSGGHLCKAEAPTEATAETHTAVWQGFLTLDSAKFTEKTCI